MRKESLNWPKPMVIRMSGCPLDLAFLTFVDRYLKVNIKAGKTLKTTFK